MTPTAIELEQHCWEIRTPVTIITGADVKHPLLTGAAQPVTNNLERVRAIFKDRPEPAAPRKKERSNIGEKNPESDGVADKPEIDGVEE